MCELQLREVPPHVRRRSNLSNIQEMRTAVRLVEFFGHQIGTLLLGVQVFRQNAEMS